MRRTFKVKTIKVVCKGDEGLYEFEYECAGKVTREKINEAKEFVSSMGHDVKSTYVQEGYVLKTYEMDEDVFIANANEVVNNNEEE